MRAHGDVDLDQLEAVSNRRVLLRTQKINRVVLLLTGHSVSKRGRFMLNQQIFFKSLTKLAALVCTTSITLSARGENICDQSETVFLWSMAKKPTPYEGVSFGEGYSYSNITDAAAAQNRENKYRITFTPICDGMIDIHAHEHGRGTNDPAKRKAWLRVVLEDNKEICQPYDPGYFDHYNLICTSVQYPKLKYRITKGNTTTISFHRHNRNADPDDDAHDGLRLQVTFTRE